MVDKLLGIRIKLWQKIVVVMRIKKEIQKKKRKIYNPVRSDLCLVFPDYYYYYYYYHYYIIFLYFFIIILFSFFSLYDLQAADIWWNKNKQLLNENIFHDTFRTVCIRSYSPPKKLKKRKTFTNSTIFNSDYRQPPIEKVYEYSFPIPPFFSFVFGFP